MQRIFVKSVFLQINIILQILKELKIQNLSNLIW